MKEEEVEAVLSCLSARQESYNKNQFVLHVGETVRAPGLVISGSVHIIKEDFWGNRSILAKAETGQLFGEVYACVQSEALEVSVIASEPVKVLFLDMARVLHVCSSACEFHTELIHNLMQVLAHKNLMLTRKIEHLAQRTTREKLLSYLSGESLRNGSAAFDIPFNRQQLADYLAVDRSAMSNELSKMNAEGLIEYNKNHFILIGN